MERPVDAGNLHYTAPLCAATVRVELVQTLQLSQMKTLDLIPKRPKNIHLALVLIKCEKKHFEVFLLYICLYSPI